MMLPSLLVDNAGDMTRLLAGLVVCWSWWSGFRLVMAPNPKPVLTPNAVSAGFGRF